jgi:dTDP-4-amino-4,6-dideoxygalactose transaminase
LTLFKDMGYDIKNYPIAHQQYVNEISLPIYPQLTNEKIEYILKAICESVEEVLYAQEKF